MAWGYGNAVTPIHPITKYIDALGRIIVACYLLYTGFDMIRMDKAGERL